VQWLIKVLYPAMEQSSKSRELEVLALLMVLLEVLE
jgi:hypothetical protein